MNPFLQRSVGLVKKMGEVCKQVEKEKGPCRLFALASRHTDPVTGKWFLMVSATWMDSDQAEAQKYLTGIIEAHLDEEDRKMLLWVVPTREDDPTCVRMRRTFGYNSGDNAIGGQFTEGPLQTPFLFFIYSCLPLN